MLKTHKRLFIGVAMAMACGSQVAWAAEDLTPWGAIEAGNAEGTIPPYTGGIDPASIKVSEVLRVPQGVYNKYSAPLMDEEPLFTITAANVNEYGDKVDEATKLLLQRYPDTYKLHIYPSHRTASYSDQMVENIKLNAESAKLENGGLGVTGVFGAIPFPEPKDGHEVLWNFTLRNQGFMKSTKQETWYVDARGNLILTSAGASFIEAPYLDPNMKREDYLKQDKPLMLLTSASYDAPARSVGNANLYRETLGTTYERKAWSYVQGQRRVRVAPDLAYDTPIVTAGGVLTFDDSGLFWGLMDRFDFKLVGKREMFIPYNTYKEHFWTPKEEAATKGHPNPDAVRWELHRVWVVESTLKPGYRHAYSKRTYFFDEDWAGGLQYSRDHADNIYRSVHLNSVPMPGGYVNTAGYTAFDFISGVWGRNTQASCAQCGYLSSPDKGLGQRYYTPEALQGRGVR